MVSEKFMKELEKRNEVKQQYIKELKLQPIIGYSHYYLHMPTQSIYSFVGKEPRILKGGKDLTGYKVVSMRPDNSKKFKTFGIHEIVKAVSDDIPVKSWIKDDLVCHHISGDINDNTPENLMLMDRTEHQKLSSTNKKKKSVRITDSQVIDLRNRFANSDTTIRSFAETNAKKYGLNVYSLYLILTRRSRKNVI